MWALLLRNNYQLQVWEQIIIVLKKSLYAIQEMPIRSDY